MKIKTQQRFWWWRQYKRFRCVVLPNTYFFLRHHVNCEFEEPVEVDQGSNNQRLCEISRGDGVCLSGVGGRGMLGCFARDLPMAGFEALPKRTRSKASRGVDAASFWESDQMNGRMWGSRKHFQATKYEQQLVSVGHPPAPRAGMNECTRQKRWDPKSRLKHLKNLMTSCTRLSGVSFWGLSTHSTVNTQHT